MFLDNRLFHLINIDLHNRLFDAIFPVITSIGGGDVLFVIAVIAVIISKGRKKMSGILLIAGLTISYHVVGFLKSWIARPRPFVALSDAYLLVAQEKSFSFPSGHASMIFIAAVIFSYFYRKLSPVFFFVAILVCISRVYVGVHYPADVAAGALTGASIGYLLIYALRSSGISSEHK